MLTQMKQWMTPPYFESDEEKKNQRHILSTMIWALWGGYLFVAATALYYKDWQLFIVTLTGCALLMLPMLLLKRRKLHASGLFVVLSSIGTVTLIATVGQGIRDLAIVAYPMIFIFAGLTLSREFFRISVGLTLITVCWLVLGEINGWFVAKPFDGEAANWFYLIATTILLLIAALSVDLLTGNMRKSLERARQEIARRKQADDHVRASEARFRAVVEHNCNGMVFLSAERKINYASPAYIQLLGFTPEELIGHFGMEYIYPEDQKRAEQDFAELLQTSGQHRITQYRLRHKDGSAVWVEATSANLLGDPHVQAIVLSHHNINERKLVEEEMQKSQKRFHALIEHGRDNISLLSADGILLWESPSTETVLGYPPDAFKGHSIFELVHPEDQAQAHQVYTQVLQSPKILQAGEARLQHADGTWRWLEYSAINLLDEPSVGAIVLNYRDITMRKQADVRMREIRDQMQVAQEMGQTGSWVYRLETQKIWATANARGIFGYAALAGDFPLEEMESCIPERERVHQALLSLISEERPYELEYIIHPADGAAPKIIHAIARVEKDAQGNPLKVHGFIQDITERKQHKNELEAIATLSAALRTAPTRAEMLPMITRQLVALLNCETVSVEIIDPLTGDTITEAAYGTWKTMIGIKQKNGTGINAIIRQTRQPYQSNDWKNDPNLTYPEWARGDINSGAGAPLIAQDKLIGFVWMGCKTNFSKSEVRLLTAVADIAASAIHRATLHEQTKKDAADLTLAYDTTLEGWAHALELRDQETEGHTRRVTQLTLHLARAMGIDGAQLENIRRGALLHDIGKMGIPDAILRKPGQLDEHEWEIMKQHPEYAYKLLAPIEYLRPVLDIPYCHHERWDGTGYPRNLKGEEIPLVARIFSIVDVWDALTSDRPYRKAWDREKALAHITEQNSKHFDPAVVDAFMRIDHQQSLLG